jgi:hypothetical protein
MASRRFYLTLLAVAALAFVVSFSLARALRDEPAPAPRVAPPVRELGPPASFPPAPSRAVGIES